MDLTGEFFAFAKYISNVCDPMVLGERFGARDDVGREANHRTPAWYVPIPPGHVGIKGTVQEIGPSRICLSFFWLLLGGMHLPAPRVDSDGQWCASKQARDDVFSLLNEKLKNP